MRRFEALSSPFQISIGFLFASGAGEQFGASGDGEALPQETKDLDSAVDVARVSGTSLKNNSGQQGRLPLWSSQL